MPRKTHYVYPNGKVICGRVNTSGFAGFGGAADITHKKNQVTCKQCLRELQIIESRESKKTKGK